MAAPKVSLNVTSISKSVFNTNKSLDTAGKTAFTINKTLVKRNENVKRNIATDNLLFARRRENVRRKEQESIIESSGIGGVVRRQGRIISESTKGFLGRMLDFVGTILVGWLLNNLPTIIGLAQELIARIQRLVGIFNTFINTTGTIFKTLGSSLGAIFSDIVKFQFTFPETRSQFDKSMFELEDAFSQLTSSFDDAVKLFTDPLSTETEEGTKEGTYSGENMPAPGSTWGGEEKTTGGKVSPQTVYSYLKSKGISHNHAMGIIAGIDGESSFQIGVQEKGNSKQGIGLFQYTHPSRKQPFLQAVPDYKTNWKGQVDYAISKDPNTAIYLSRQFSTPEQAAEWWLINWERPREDLRSSRRTKYKQFIASFKPGGAAQTASSNQPSALPPRQNGSTDTGTALAKTAERLRQQRLDTSRYGRDGCVFAVNEVYRVAGIPTPWGSSVYVPTVRKILTQKKFIQVGINDARPGDIVIMLDTHPTEPWVHIGVVSTKGTVIHNSSTNKALTNDESFSSLSKRYVKIEVFRDPNLANISGKPQRVSGSSTSYQLSPSPAQVATQRPRATAVAGQVTQERRGPTVFVAPQGSTPTPSPMGGYGSPGGGETVVIDPLNRYTTQKLLLELAYT